MRTNIQVLSSSKIVVSLKWKVPDKLRSALKFNIHRHRTNTNIQVIKRASITLTGRSPSVKEFYSQDVRAERGIWDNLSVFYTFFFFHQESLFSPVPKFYFKATNLERIKAKLLWVEMREMVWWESHPLSSLSSLRPFCGAQTPHLTIPWHSGNWESNEDFAQPKDTQLTKGTAG